MTDAMPVEARISIAKGIPPDFAAVDLGPYRLMRDGDTGESSNELRLVFDSVPLDGHCHPEEETVVITQILALMLNTKARRHGFRIAGIDVPTFDPERRDTYRDYYGTANPTNLARLGPRIFGAPEDLGRQYVRAARAYAAALDVVGEDHTFAFFLFVVAVECLSSQDAVIPHNDLHPAGKTCERFCEFIRRFLPEGLRQEDEKDPVLLDELLKTAYYAHRSAFVHGGKEVSHAAVLADQVGSSYVKHSTDGPEVKTPGVAWFARIVRYSLLGFLESLPSDRLDATLIARIAAERGRLKLKPKLPAERGDVLTMPDDFDYR